MNLSKFSFAIFLLLVMCLISCIYSCTPDPDQSVTTKNNCDFLINTLQERASVSMHKPVYIILCDFTSSLDTQSIKNVSDNVAQIFDHYYNKAILKFYPVVNGSRVAFFESDMLSIIDSSQIEEGEDKDFQECLIIRKQELAISLQESIKKTAQERPLETYLIQCLQNAMNIIEMMDLKHQQKDKIFILSDMLESGNSPFGKLNLEDHSSIEDLQKVDAFKDTADLVKFSENIDLHIALYSKSSKDQNMVMKFWNVILKKLGYTERVRFASELLLD